MQLYFRLDKRPGESHLALDGKKEFNGDGDIVFARFIFCTFYWR